MTNTAYLLEHVTFSYVSRDVLSIDRLAIPSGVVTAILGPNGSGKTTLLQMLSFVDQPTGGKISFFGKPLTRANRLSFRRRIGYLTQKPYLFNTTVYENVAWALKLRGWDKKRIREACTEALDRVDLKGFDKRPARLLSGGETQRVALARALAIDPEVFLFDEPTSHLDTKSHTLINEIIADLSQSATRTILVITHDYSDIEKFTPNFIEMASGRIVNSKLDT